MDCAKWFYCLLYVFFLVHNYDVCVGVVYVIDSNYYNINIYYIIICIDFDLLCVIVRRVIVCCISVRMRGRGISYPLPRPAT